MAEQLKDEVAAENQALRARIEQLEKQLVNAGSEEAKRQALLETAPDIILLLDTEGRILYINRTAHGYQMENVLGKSAYGFVLPDRRDKLKALVAEVAATGEIHQLELPFQGSDEQETAWYDVRIGPVNEGGPIVGVTCIATNITDRILAEVAREETELRLEALCNISPVGIVLVNLRGQCTYVNQRFCEIVGRTTEQLLGNGWRDAMPSEHQTLTKQNDSQKPKGAVFQILRPDGSDRWVYCQTVAERNSRDEITGHMTALTDMTETRRTDHALRESEERWRSAADTAFDYIMLVDPDGTLKYINRVSDEFNIEDVIDSCAYDFVAPEYREMTRRNYEKAYETGEIVEFELLGRGGPTAWRWYRSRVGPHRQDGRVVGVIVFVNDITRQKTVDKALEACDERFRVFMDNSPLIAFIKEPAGCYLYGNARWREHLDRPMEELLGQPDRDLFPPDVAEQFMQTDRQALASASPTHFLETTYANDRSKRWWSVFKFPLNSSGGDTVIGGLALEITDRKRYQEKLEAEEQLLRKLLDLQERERKLVAHDIHDGFVQDVVGAKMMLEGAISEFLPADKKHDCDKIIEQLGRAIEEARRLIGGLRPLIIDEQGIVEAIRYLVFDPRFCPNLKVEFSCDVSFERLDPMLEGALFRIVQEALVNASRHSQSDHAEVKLKQHDDQINLEVTDAGVGFDARRVGQDRFGIRGIRERARLFGGIATISSKTGEGTRIKVQLPMGQRDSRPSQAP